MLTTVALILGITALVLFIGAGYVITDSQRKRVFVIVVAILALVVLAFALFR